MANSSRFLKTYRLHTLLSLGALVLQFILGMYTSLFVTFPDTLVKGNAWAWTFTQSPIIVVHIILGLLLVLMALSTLGFGFASHNRTALTWAVIGLVMMGVAFLSGAVFLSNVNENASSFAMALGFMGSLLAYGVAFYLTRPELKA